MRARECGDVVDPEEIGNDGLCADCRERLIEQAEAEVPA